MSRTKFYVGFLTCFLTQGHTAPHTDTTTVMR